MSSENKYENTDTAPLPDATTDPSTMSPNTSAFIERMKKLFEFTKSNCDELKDLYTSDPEAFQDALDDCADKVADHDPEYQRILSNLKEARRLGADDTPLVQSLREIHGHLKQIIISEAGLPDEARFSEIEQAKGSIANLLSEAGSEHALAQPKDALRAIGIITGEDSDEKYQFPYDLIPQSVSDKWTTYLAAVCNHVQVQKDVRGKDGHDAVERADRTRRFAHNSVTDDVHVILGFETAYDWKKEQTRELLAKIRDHEFPSYASAVSAEARELVHAKTNEISIADILGDNHLIH